MTINLSKNASKPASESKPRKDKGPPWFMRFHNIAAQYDPTDPYFVWFYLFLFIIPSLTLMLWCLVILVLFLFGISTEPVVEWMGRIIQGHNTLIIRVYLWSAIIALISLISIHVLQHKYHNRTRTSQYD